MIITDLFESHQQCPECGGPAFSDLILAEKKDACYYKVKASAKVWPSAYASGRLVQCRKKGADNYGKSKNEGVAEGNDPASAKFGKYIKQYFDQIYEYGDDGLNYLDNNAPFWASLFDKHDGDIDYIIAIEPADVLKQAALELKDVAGDLKYELDEQGVAEEQLDEKCWDGYQQQGTKNKGGRQVPNCVPAESVNEMDKSQTPPGRDGSNDSDAGKKEYTAKPTTAKKVAKDGEKILNKELNKKQGMAEGFPHDVDHMPGPVIRNADMTTDNVKTRDKAEWNRATDSINARVFDDMSEFRTDSKGETVVGDSAVWAKWDNATQTGWFNAKGRPLKPWPIKEQGVAKDQLDEGWKSALGAAAMAGTMALGSAGANARVTPDGQGGFTGGLKPSATVTAPADNKPAAEAPKGFSKEYLQSVVDGKHPRPMVSVEKAKELLKNMQEGMERAVDAKGRTQAQWAQLVMSKFPGAKITQAKMIDGPMQATLPDGRKIGWSKVEQIDEIFNPSSMLAIFMRAASRFVSDFLPIGIGAISTYAATTALIGPFAAAAASTAVGNQLFQTLQNQQNKVPGVIQMMVEKYFGSEAEKVEFMILHAKNAYQGKSEFRWRGEQWPVTLQKDEAEAIIEKNDKYWLDAEKQKEIDAEKAKIDAGKTDIDFAKEQGMAEDQVNEKSVSQAQFRTMAAAAHNPEFAKKVGIKQSVAKEFNQADKGSNYKKLPDRTTEGEQQKGADYRDPPEADYGNDYQDMVARVKKLAGLGPLKTVYDPARRVYRNVPTAVQPKK